KLFYQPVCSTWSTATVKKALLAIHWSSTQMFHYSPSPVNPVPVRSSWLTPPHTSRACPWSWAANRQPSSSKMLTWTTPSTPRSSVCSPSTVNAAPPAPVSWSSALFTMNSSSATQLRLPTSKLVSHPIQRPKSVLWFTQNILTKFGPMSRSAKKKPAWLPVASARKNSRKETSCSQQYLLTSPLTPASSRKRSSARLLQLRPSILTKKHSSWPTTPATVWPLMSGPTT